MERIHIQWPSILTASDSEAAHVRALKRTYETIARSMRPYRRAHRPRLGSVSRAWLREHEAESEKHDPG